MWRQRLRVTWLREGDRNTNIFHRKANWRQSKNNIKRIRGLNGNSTDDPQEIKDLATNFFKNLFTRDASINPVDLLDICSAPTPELYREALCNRSCYTIEGCWVYQSQAKTFGRCARNGSSAHNTPLKGRGL